MTPPETHLFKCLPGRRFSLRAFAASVVLHGIVLILAVCLPLALVPEVRYRIVEITPPLVLPQLALRPTSQPERSPIRAPLVTRVPRVAVPRAEIGEVKIPEIRRPAKNVVDVELPRPEILPPTTPLPAPSRPNPLSTPSIKLGVFPEGASDGIRDRAPRELLTTGFDDRTDNPERETARGDKAVLGAFDAPSKSEGPSGSSRKGREIVVGSGFGDGVAPGSAKVNSRAHDPTGSVREGSFSNYLPSTPANQSRPRPVKPNQVAAEIIFKPKPAYTREARDLGLEGEVVLEVLLTASGEVRVLKLIRGLGHGLDEAAIRAAEQIRFKPAENDGRPVDSRSVVQLIFRLT